MRPLKHGEDNKQEGAARDNAFMYVPNGSDRFVHRPVFWKLENATFRRLHLFPSSGEGGDAFSVGSLTKRCCSYTDTGCPMIEISSFWGTQKLCPLSPDEGNKPGFRNVLCYLVLEYRTTDKVQKPSNSDYILVGANDVSFLKVPRQYTFVHLVQERSR
jgi:hypothetical protein